MVNQNDLLKYRNGGNVTRFHTSKMVTPQDNAQHSYNSALIAEAVAEEYNNNNRRSTNVNTHYIVMHMLVHDVPERHIGDSPGFAKAMYPELREALNNAEEKWCKEELPERMYNYMYGLNSVEDMICSFVDRYECALKGFEEHQHGGREGIHIFNSCIAACNKIYTEQELDVALRIIFSRMITDLLVTFNEYQGEL